MSHPWVNGPIVPFLTLTIYDEENMKSKPSIKQLLYGNTNEIPLMRMFLAEYRNPIVRLFRRNIVNKTVRDLHSERRFQVVSGITGQCDVYGFIKRGQYQNSDGRDIFYNAIPIEVEFKAAKTPESDEQLNWSAWCREWGVLHIQLRAEVEEAPVTTVLRWTVELNALVSSLS